MNGFCHFPHCFTAAIWCYIMCFQSDLYPNTFEYRCNLVFRCTGTQITLTAHNTSAIGQIHIFKSQIKSQSDLIWNGLQVLLWEQLHRGLYCNSLLPRTITHFVLPPMTAGCGHLRPCFWIRINFRAYWVWNESLHLTTELLGHPVAFRWHPKEENICLQVAESLRKLLWRS